MTRILVTGGAGFIGGAVCRRLVRSGRHQVVNVDALTYCGNLASLGELEASTAYRFHHADVRDGRAMEVILRAERIEAVLHLAAESHVDRSIDAPGAFIDTNVVGTATLLDAAVAYWRDLDAGERGAFRFHHVSTDEVFGDLEPGAPPFDERTPYAPSSPYAASKAASDHLVRAWNRTYGLPVVLSNCSNNYGPFQHPEKLIPLTILNAVEGLPLPVYGTGTNVRDWLHVDDHVDALERVLAHGTPGATYLIGGRAERTNLQVVEAICDLLDAMRPRTDRTPHRSLIRFVSDRPGHDRRYAVDPGTAERALGWSAGHDFATGLAATVRWYLHNEWWWRPLRERGGATERLGLAR